MSYKTPPTGCRILRGIRNIAFGALGLGGLGTLVGIFTDISPVPSEFKGLITWDLSIADASEPTRAAVVLLFVAALGIVLLIAAYRAYEHVACWRYYSPINVVRRRPWRWFLW